MKDFYYILGLDSNCTSIEIREAYRKLSKKFHPDLNDADGYFESRFQQISEAYDVLNDPDKRKNYDAALKKSKSLPEEVKKRPGIFKTTYINIAFSLTLAFITALFGYYVYQSLNPVVKSKAVNGTTIAVIAPVHHKRKHRHKNQAAESDITKNESRPITPFRFKADTVVKKPVLVANNNVKKQIPADPKIIKDTIGMKAISLANNNAKKKPVLPVVATSSPIADNAQAAAYIRANLTGVVNMRRLDAYNSDIVGVIPDNAKIQVLERGSSYFKVTFGNKTGYVPRWAVHTK